MQYSKNTLIELASKIEQEKKLSPAEMAYISSFERKPEATTTDKLLKNAALPLSLALGFFFTVFPDRFQHLVDLLPAWMNFSPPFLSGVDYLWDLIGDPVGKANIIYHIPNIVLYSFGVFGIKKLFDTLDKKTWLDRVLAAKVRLATSIKDGSIPLSLAPGHSVLFIGKGDFIGMQFVLNHSPDMAVSISEVKPSYTDIWNYYDPYRSFEDLQNVLLRVGQDMTGEYIFFPVKDDQIFLPSLHSYDLSPHKLDILCQNIRNIEREQGWTPNRIIIVGDRFHKDIVQSEDEHDALQDTQDTISLESIAHKYENITLIDPSDVVLKRILELADGRKIVFRATRDGLAEYKQRFYGRLTILGYTGKPTKKGILTIGHDLSEDYTEQQTLARKIDDYYPIVLSKNVRDALIRNGYKEHEFMYVPDLVLRTLSYTADQQ